MDLQLVLSIIGLLYIGVTIYLANDQQVAGYTSRVVRWMLYGIASLSLYLGLAVIGMATVGTSEMTATADMPLPVVTMSSALAYFVLAMTVFIVSILVVSSHVSRLQIQRVIGSQATYDADSLVHTTAVVMALALVSFTAGTFVLGGGMTGLAETIETTGISTGAVLFQGILWVVVAFLGVGFAIRRGVRETLVRLGLRAPTRDDVRVGVLAGLVLFLFGIIAGAIWLVLLPEQYAEQNLASEQISQAISTLPLALTVALSAGIGEEILFRGALQPVFGLVPSSIVFVAVHSQYTLTPASLIILVVALVLGWVRQRYSTTAAIIGHFVYNLILLLIALLASAAGGQVP